MTREAALPVVLIALTMAAGGCNGPFGGTAMTTALQNQVDGLRKDNDDLRKANAALHAQAAANRKQIESLLDLGDKRLEKLYPVTALKLGSHTGGIDQDGRPGHDAVKVFLEPIDQDGNVIKAAGEVTIQLFDLAAKDTLVAQYAFGVDEVRKHWSSGFLAYHYSFVCPWPQARPPQHDQITVRVVFRDYLTGKQFTAQSDKPCRILLPGAAAAK